MPSFKNFSFKFIAGVIVLLAQFSFLFLSTSVNVSAARTTRRVVVRKKVVSKKVAPKIRYVESIYTCISPSNRSYSSIKKFVLFDNLDKCKDFAKQEQNKILKPTEEVKSTPQVTEVKNESKNSNNAAVDYNKNISNTDQTSNKNNSNIVNAPIIQPTPTASNPVVLSYLTPNDVGNSKCDMVNNVYSCQFEIKTPNVSIDNPNTTQLEYLKLAVRSFNGATDLSTSATCFLGDSKMYCNGINLSNLGAGEYYLYFVGNHTIQWMNFGKFTAGKTVDVSVSMQQTPSCAAIINYFCDLNINLVLKNEGSQTLNDVITRIYYPVCVAYTSTGATDVTVSVYGTTADVRIITLDAGATKTIPLVFKPQSFQQDNCQTIQQGAYNQVQFFATTTIPSNYLDSNLYNNSASLQVLIEKPKG